MSGVRLVMSLEPAAAAKFSAQPANSLSKQITNTVLNDIRDTTDADVAVFVTEFIKNGKFRRFTRGDRSGAIIIVTITESRKRERVTVSQRSFTVD